MKKATHEENQRLRAAYIAAEQDEDRLKTIQEWSVLDLENCPGYALNARKLTKTIKN